jgi:hypothetical protein
MLISPRKGKYRYYTTVQAVRCFPKLASPKQLTVGTCAAFFFRHFCWEAAEQKGWHQVLAKIRSFKEGEAASCTEISN